MPLLLRLDNVDTLPDGGPVTYEVERRGLDIGRDSYLDWTLPDAERFISGKHCEIRYRDGGYWLHDVSTNGTTLNGQSGRLTEPYRLQDGDRIHIGQYIVAVEVTGEDAAAADPATSPAAASDADPWGGVDNAAETIDRRDFAAHVRPGDEGDARRGPSDLSEENISWSVGQITEGAATDADIWGAQPAGGAAASGDWGWTPPPMPAAPTSEAPPAPTPLADEQPGEAAAPVPAPDIPAPEVDPFSPPAEATPTAPPVEETAAAEPAHAEAEGDPVPTPAAGAMPTDAPPAAAAPDSGLASRWEGGAAAAEPPSAPGPAEHAPSPAGGFIAAFERGAGMPAGSLAERGDDELAEELGTLFRLVAQNLQAMLAARAETKSAMRSSERTMIGALENNPLKFSPTPEDALRIMFGAKSRSYLDATKTVEQSFGDLQKHQMQTFAAMQQALQALIEDLDPAGIEEATAKDGGLAGIVGSRRAKFWDTYVERFRAKSGRHERGMIDAFMILFAEMYDRQR